MVYDGIGEIDYLIAGSVIDTEPETTDMRGHGPLQVMSDREILAQKIHYRAAGFSGRDLYDFAIITAMRPGLLQDPELRNIAEGRRLALESRLESSDLKDDYDAVVPHDDAPVRLDFERAREALRKRLDAENVMDAVQAGHSRNRGADQVASPAPSLPTNK